MYVFYETSKRWLVLFLLMSAALWRQVLAFDVAEAVAQLYWQDERSGKTIATFIAPPVQTQSIVTHPSGGTWRVAGSGDFNGDGFTDLYWRDENTGANVIELWRGTQFLDSVKNSVIPMSAGWYINAIADFTGDGHDDVLWRHVSSGEVWMHQILSGELVASVQVTAIRDISWNIQLTPDLDGDGKSDILLRHHQTGVVWRFLMDGHQIIDSRRFMNAAPHWQLALHGDFDADGDDDLLWRNTQNGQSVIHRVKGGDFSRHGMYSLGILDDMHWQPVWARDLDDDGDDDIIWHHDRLGYSSVYLLGSTGYIGQLLPSLAESGWRPVR